MNRPRGRRAAARGAAPAHQAAHDRAAQETGGRPGPTIRGGPFAGTRYPAENARTSGPARLLGTHEQPLWEWIEQARKRDYTEIVCIGCDDGYYPGGLARRMSVATVRAYYRQASTRTSAAQLWGENGVGERVLAAREPTASVWLETSRRGRRLIFIDGYEPHERLADQLAAAARHADVIIKNDERTAAAAAALERAAAASHTIERIDHRGERNAPASGWDEGLGELDRILAAWEWRMGQVSWTRATRKD